MKKVFVVVVSDWGNGLLNSPEIFHIRALDSDKAVECAKDIFVEDYSFSQEDVDDELDFFAYELDDSNIIDA